MILSLLELPVSLVKETPGAPGQRIERKAEARVVADIAGHPRTVWLLPMDVAVGERDAGLRELLRIDHERVGLGDAILTPRPAGS